jgi:hypothetical protein
MKLFKLLNSIVVLLGYIHAWTSTSFYCWGTHAGGHMMGFSIAGVIIGLFKSILRYIFIRQGTCEGSFHTGLAIHEALFNAWTSTSEGNSSISSGGSTSGGAPAHITGVPLDESHIFV